MKLTNCKIFDSEKKEFIMGSVFVNEATGMIDDVCCGDTSLDGTDLGGKMLIPGLIDVHTHGRNGYDFTSANKEQMTVMAKGYLSKGVTTVMPTLASAPMDALIASSEAINELKGSREGSRFAGVHLEGRYLNVSKRGAHHPDLIAPLNANELSGLIDKMKTPCHISAALELDSDGSFMNTALEKGATLGLGHTGATCKQALEIYEKGKVSFTHTYNAMTPLHHREAGVVGAALLCDSYCELICDGLHICPEVVSLTYRIKGGDRLVLITDSTEATGHGDGEYTIAGMQVVVKNGKALTSDGALSGSTLELADGIRNLVRFAGVRLEDVLNCATLNPAKMIGIEGECGSIEKGKRADLLIAVEDEERIFDIKSIIIGGAYANV